MLWYSMIVPKGSWPGFAFWLRCVTLDKLSNLSVARLCDLKSRDHVTVEWQ